MSELGHGARVVTVQLDCQSRFPFRVEISGVRRWVWTGWRGLFRPRRRVYTVTVPGDLDDPRRPKAWVAVRALFSKPVRIWHVRLSNDPDGSFTLYSSTITPVDGQGAV